jgi:iron complex outermembrane recepter protein
VIRILIPILLFFTQTISAQTVTITGRILSEQENAALEYASIALYTTNDSLIGGALSRQNGDFSIDNVPKHELVLKVNYLGYIPGKFKLNLSDSPTIKDLGNIKLSIDGELLKEVEIKAEKSQLNLGIDKRVYNIEKDLGAVGGSAIDAMKNIPGLTVNSDNSVNLRNQSPTIFIDGQPSPLSLDQIPSSDIDRIEVITNPSVKYTASSTGGIINVILKKNLKPGYYGQLNSTIGSNQRRSLGGNLNQREKSFSIQASGNYYFLQNNNNGSSLRQYYSNDIQVGELSLINLNNTEKRGLSSRISSDIKLSIRSTLRLSYSYSQNEVLGKENQDFTSNGSTLLNTFEGLQKNVQLNSWKVHHGSINYRKTFPKEGKEINSDILFFASDNSNSFNFQQFNVPEQDLQYAQKNNGNRIAQYLVWQFDYTNPVKENASFEWGYRFGYKQSFSDFIVEYIDTTSNLYFNNPSLSNNYRIDDFVGAAYINYSRKYGKFGYQAGLRFEQTYFVANSINTNEIFSFIYPFNLKELNKSVFPAIYFSYNLNQKSELQINFSRKIGRPEFTQLIPFITYADRQSVQIGNPVLGPEFINIAEINYSYSADKGSLLSGIYLRQNSGAITNVLFPLSTDSTVLVSSFGNGSNKIDLGWENSIKRQIGKYLDFTVNSHLFYSKVTIQQASNTFSNSGFSYNIKGMMNVNLNSKLRVQISSSYEAPRIIAQGTINSIYYSDISANYRLNNSFSFSLTISDVFNTKRYGTRFESPEIVQETIRRWEVRYIRLNATWKFGEADQSIFRRKSNGRRDPGNHGTEMQEL